LAASAVAVARLEGHVDQQLVARYGGPTLVFVDRPARLTDLVLDELRATVADHLTRAWTEETLCRDLAERLAANAWVSRIRFVRRTGDARIEVGVVYRAPAALVQRGGTFQLVDRDGIRLPGTYLYNPEWKIIQGVAQAPPEPGRRWPGDDLAAGLAVLAAVDAEPFADQVTAVVVEDFGGRRSGQAGHIELATDRAGGRIVWGSAPGMEIAENHLDQKLAILRANFQETGRIDAGHPMIDITTYPDRFTIPG
jgi:hypothetical protein